MRQLHLKDLHLALVGIAFRQLYQKELSILEAAKIPMPMCSHSSVEQTLGIPLAEFAYVEKCNAVLLVASFEKDPPAEILNDLFKVWQKLTMGKIAKYRSLIISLKGRKAFKYLIETAIGLHSVVVGDSQVYSQTRDPIRKGAKADSSSIFRKLLRSMKKVEADIQAHTKLHRGYTSLERLACLRIKQKLKGQKAVAVVGMGSSGRLVTKILKEQQKLEVIVAARSKQDVDAVVTRYKAKHAPFPPIAQIKSISGMVLALDHNKETKRYAERIETEIKNAPSFRIIVDLASPPLLYHVPKHCELVDITTLSKMAQRAVKERSKEVEIAKNIIKKRLGMP